MDLPERVEFTSVSFGLIKKKTELFVLLYGEHYETVKPIHVYLKWFIFPEYKIVFKLKDGEKYG